MNQAPASTIAAIATPAGRGGIGIIRVSGPLVTQVKKRVTPFLFKNDAIVTPRYAHFGPFLDSTGNTVDHGIVLFFKGPNSYTGEDVVEFQMHGSPALLNLLLAHIISIEGVRLAQPGEFTRRAFLNGRIDLAQAEAVLYAIESQGEFESRAAANVLSGQFSKKIKELEHQLTQLRADYEGHLDFPEESEDVEIDFGALKNATAQITELTHTFKVASLSRRGARIVLFGPVNAGKSTLFNALAGAQKALVDEEPGTTRDVLELPLQIENISGTLVDTAGLRENPGRLEAKGIDLARQAVASADVAVLVIPPGFPKAEIDAYSQLAAAHAVLVVCNKADVGSTWNTEGLKVSGVTGFGLTELKKQLSEKLQAGLAASLISVSDRNADILERVFEGLARAVLASENSTLEVVSGELGMATLALGEMTGTNVSEAVLDAMFQRFCIGK
jgi:tRNA modification GTPase